jgi:Tol biopolymer transport system component/DNA-binding winged helix-turn-helix (wHTH) protein
MDRHVSAAFEFGPFRMDLAEHVLLRHGRPVPLTPKMFDLLHVLVEHAGHLVHKEQLLNEVWPGTFVEEGNLSRGISLLRKTLGESPTDKYIETVPKLGYRFVAPVRRSIAVSANLDDTPVPASQKPPKLPPPSAPGGSTLFIAAVVAAVILTTGAVLFTAFPRQARNTFEIATSRAVHRQLTFTGREVTPSLSPDGRRIAYVSRQSPRRKVMVQELAGGDPVVMFSAPEAGALRWSPDGSELMFWARGEGTDGLYIAPSSGGPARRLTSNLFISCWSPDGGTIALALFVARQIHFINTAGELERTISFTGTFDWIWDMDWSRDHDRLLFVADDVEHRPTVWTIRPDGSGQTRVFTGTSEILAARWAPGGEAFYYFSRVNQTVSLYKVRLGADGVAAEPGPLLLISGLEADEGYGVSADGTRFVYARSPYYSNLWSVKLVDSPDGPRIRQTPLTNGTSVIERPHVSPDGTTVLFSIGFESRANLYTMPAGGGAPRQFTFLNAFSIGGVWSPDGRSIAFASNEGGRARVWTANADGGALRPHPTGEMSESYDLAWAPGRRLLYQQAANRNYYWLDPYTGRQDLLVKDASVGWLGPVVYSPDGRRIAVSWNRQPHPGLWLIDADDSTETQLLDVSGTRGSMPFPIGWSADGAYVFAVDGKRAAYRGVSAPYEETMADARILRIPVADGPAETVLTLPFEEVGSLSVLPDGRTFLCVVYTSRSDVWVVEDFDVSNGPRLARRARASTR